MYPLCLLHIHYLYIYLKLQNGGTNTSCHVIELSDFRSLCRFYQQCLDNNNNNINNKI